tara:strand:- start:283 stop:555 length:273 start_codon:yes stop_codon:yes gene_type:complete
MSFWYRIDLFRGHVGAGKAEEKIVYMFARDFNSVLQRYKSMPGVKRGKIPNIRELNAEEARSLEIKILEDSRINMLKAKKRWVYEDQLNL